jgi:hypothetical protein
MEQNLMRAMMETQELARLFNEDEAVWRCYHRKRASRAWLDSRLPLAEHILDYFDWLAAERECRQVRAIGFFLS